MAQFVGGRYQLIAQLGGGGMADVFLAKQMGKGDFAKLNVIKRLKHVEDEEPEVVRMFADEARISARLNHPNIVQTFEVGEDTEGPFLVMEYLEGQPLGRIRSRAARREKPLPRSIGLRVLTEILAALSYAHTLTDHDGAALDVVHRDVSPENIMVTYAGLTKLLDFGVAKTLGAASKTRSGVLKGKVAYMAPEQARSDVSIDHRADLFAAGLILWELLTGRRMWEGCVEQEVFRRLLDEEPMPRAKSVDDTVPDELDEICAKALEKVRDDRFESAAAFLEALEGACNKTDLRASAREVGQFVADLFAVEREKLRAAVSGSTKPVTDDSGESLPQLASMSGKTQPPRLDESDPMLWKAISSGTLPKAATTTSTPVETESEADGEKKSSASPASPVPPPPPAEEKGGRGFVYALGALAAVGLAVYAGTRITSGPEPVTNATPPPATTAPPTPTVSATPPASASAEPEAPKLVTIDIAVRPTSAKISIDGTATGANPAKLKVASADSSHEIRAEADGYESHSVVVAFDRDRTIDVALVKKAPTAQWTAPVAPPPKTAAAPAKTVAPSTQPSSPPAPSRTSHGISEINPTPTGTPTAKKDTIDKDVFKR